MTWNQGFEIIIVDTSGRHKQEDSLFEEMLAVKFSRSQFFYLNGKKIKILKNHPGTPVST